jgi:5-methylcytosine-specific restriction protein A
MSRFDSELRGTKEWQGWEDNKAHKYAIEDTGRRYPVKQVLSLATGVPVSEFSGGAGAGQANQRAREAGFEVVSLHARNPDWSRDELILALDLYLRHRSSPPGKNSTEVVDLSALLNRIATKLHGDAGKEKTYRNANGVYMKLMNFRRFDPEYTSTGKKGLTAGNKDEEVVWRQLAVDPARFHAIAQAIIHSLEIGGEANGEIDEESIDLLEEAPEGRLLTRVHMRRERNRKLVDSKKRSVLNQGGALICEVCGFDFKVGYGDRGDGFIECHHTKPLEMLEPGGNTHVRDLALVCSNCHRMIHRRRPWLTVDQLRQHVVRHNR